MKKKFVLRIDEDVYEAIEKWAADEFRSANGQIEWILMHQLKLNGRYKNLKASRGLGELPAPGTTEEK